jgi:choline dehydrogenase
MDAWAEEVGDDTYKWEHMVEYLGRSATFFANPHRAGDDVAALPSTSGDGPLKVTKPAYVSPLSFHGLEAFSPVGLGQRRSVTSGSLDGVGWWQFTVDPATGLRSSAETSFLALAFNKPDSRLRTYTNTVARRILFNNKRAIGVVVSTVGVSNRLFTLRARKEVIVAAGPYHSPQLLMVSGVGNKDVLEPLGIPVVSNLKGVGQKMHDSCYLAGPVHEVSTPGTPYWRESARMASATAQLLSNASGPLTNIGVDIAVWDLLPQGTRKRLSQASRDKLDTLPADWPLVEFSISSANRVLHTIEPGRHYGTIDCILVAATSRGNMTIVSGNMLDPPVIDPNWLRDETDQEVAVQAYRRAREVWEAISDNIRLGDEVYPGKDVETDAELLEAIKAAMGPIHHASSSCECCVAD